MKHRGLNHVDRGKSMQSVYIYKKYYSGDEIIVIIGDVCRRMGSLNDSTCFAFDD